MTAVTLLGLEDHDLIDCLHRKQGTREDAAVGAGADRSAADGKHAAQSARAVLATPASPPLKATTRTASARIDACASGGVRSQMSGGHAADVCMVARYARRSGDRKNEVFTT